MPAQVNNMSTALNSARDGFQTWIWLTPKYTLLLWLQLHHGTFQVDSHLDPLKFSCLLWLSFLWMQLMLLKHLNRILYLENWEHTEINWEESRLHYRCAKLLTWTYICVLLPIRSNTQAWFPCDQYILSHQRTGECVQTQKGMDTASVLVKVLSLALSCILGLTWPDYSVFGSSQDFAGFSSNILRPFAFSQGTTVTSMFLSCTSYHRGIHVHSQEYQPYPWEPDSWWGPKARTPDLICDSLSFALPSQNCDFSLLTSPQRQSPKRTCLGCKTSRSVTSVWPSSPSGPLVPPASVKPLLFPWVLLQLTRLLSSKCSCVFQNLGSPLTPSWEERLLPSLSFLEGRIKFLRNRWLLSPELLPRSPLKKSLFFHSFRARNKKIFT